MICMKKPVLTDRLFFFCKKNSFTVCLFNVFVCTVLLSNPCSQKKQEKNKLNLEGYKSNAKR